MDLQFLLSLALILLSTKLLGLLTKRFQMPQVVGALLAGLLLGPAMLNILGETDFIEKIAELGVIILMFCAGLETDFNELKKTGAPSFVVALIGVIVPLVGGFLVALFLTTPDTGTNAMLQYVFIGVILSATSVSITVETLKEMGKLSTRAGNTILSAAIIDDILGIIALTFITAMADSSVNVWMVLLKIVGFFVFAGVFGFLFFKLYKKWTDYYHKDLRRFIIVAFVFCLLMSFCADRFFGVADITGAYLAGLLISGTKVRQYVSRRFNTLSYILCAPVFFASIGLKVVLPEMSAQIVIFSIVLILVAILTKIVGCGLGARMFGYSKADSLRVGVGMISRGEVALIVANKGAAVGLMSATLFGPIILVVVVTSIVSPILLKLAFRKHVPETEHQDSQLTQDVSTQIDMNQSP